MVKSFLQFIVYSNIWIAAGAAFFTHFFYDLNDYPPNYKLIGFIFISAILTYNFQRFIKLKSTEKQIGNRMEWMDKHQKLIRSLMLMSIVGLGILSFHLSLLSIIIFIVLGSISFLYVFDIKTKSGYSSNLRDIPMIKIIIIAIVWSTSCSIVPYIELSNYSQPIAPVFSSFLLFFISITIPLDIRDIDVDEKNKKTIPQVFGINGSKVIAISILLISLLIIKLSTTTDWVTLLPAYIISVVLILLSTKNRVELFYSLGVDGLLIILPTSYYLLNNL